MLCFSIQRTRKNTHDTWNIKLQSCLEKHKKHMFKQHDTISYKDLNIIGCYYFGVAKCAKGIKKNK